MTWIQLPIHRFCPKKTQIHRHLPPQESEEEEPPDETDPNLTEAAHTVRHTCDTWTEVQYGPPDLGESGVSKIVRSSNFHSNSSLGEEIFHQVTCDLPWPFTNFVHLRAAFACSVVSPGGAKSSHSAAHMHRCWHLSGEEYLRSCPVGMPSILP